MDSSSQTQLGSGIDYDMPDYGSDSSVILADNVNTKIKLYNNLDKMPVRKRRAFIKLMQYQVLSEALDAAKNLKNTPEKVWKSVIAKLNSIKGLSAGVDPSGKDFNKFLEMFIPALGMLAGLCLALRQAEKEEREAAEPELDPEFPDTVNAEVAEKECKKKADENIRKSVVLQMCDLKENGFSNNAS
jgi:hypothetical protein